jgi:hypothetical protein
MSYYTYCERCGKQIELPAFEGDGVFSRDYPHKCDIPVTNPTIKRGCFVFGPTSWEDQKKLAKANWKAIDRIAGQLQKRREGR